MNNTVLDAGLKILNEYVNDNKIPGAALAFVTKDKVYKGHVGYRQLVNEKLEVEEDTIYDLASLTKVVSTTTMALSLMEKGYFSLKTPLKELLPEFRFPEVNMRHVLTHTSGICFDDKAYKSLKGRQQFLEFVCQKALEFTPGSKVVYSDFGYVLLGFVIENLVGSLDEYSKKLIFDPLKMKDTVYNPDKHGLANRCAASEDTKDRGIIKGEVHDGKGYRLNGLSGNAGLFSTTSDLSRFVQMLLNDGELDNEKVLSKSTINLLKKCYTDGLNDRRTLGWIISDPNANMGDYYSDECIFHTGFTGTSLYIDFKKECGIILLTNRIHPSRDNTSIMDLRNKIHNVMIAEYEK